MPKRAIAPTATKRPARSKAKLPKTEAPAAGNGRIATTKSPSDAAGKAPSRRPATVTIRSETGVSMSIPLGVPLQRAATEWARVVQNRARWAAQADARLTQAQRSRDTLEELGVQRKTIEALAFARVVQVSIPFTSEAVGWEARIFPWEYVLAAALRETRTQPFVVVRQLARASAKGSSGGGAGTTGIASPQQAMIIESVPDPLRQRFSFESERHLVAAKLRPLEVKLLPDASPDQARDHVARLSPEVVHLAGFDTHQGAALLGLPDSGFDGYMMIDDRSRPLPVRAEDLGAILNVGSRPLRLVACNFQNSAARVAAMAVAMGAEAAIGFQDRVDDAVAEAFYAIYYARWQAAGWDQFEAFRGSFMDLATLNPESLSGSGIVLWSARDVLAGPAGAAVGTGVPAVPAAVAPPPPPETAAAGRPGGPESAASGAATGSSGAPRPAPLTTQLPIEQSTPGVASIVSMTPDVWVKPSVIRRVNYSLLHNDRALFDSFAIHNSTGRPVDDVQVEVTLYAGGDSFPYRRSLRLEGPITELRKEIRVPLTSTLLRGVRESLQSVVYISVRRGAQSLYQDTVPVSLVPIEEWTSTDADEQWLPSFVLPRDPAVDEVVQTARALLCTLLDSPTASFDGYQRVDLNQTDPYEPVDLQVRALWSTLAFHYNIAYINPPPTYSSRAQRLRSPSSILGSRAGTCVDLALLLASCLEYVEIYPVIVLYDGHASVGYWRGHDLHAAFQVVKPPTGGGGEDAGDTDGGADGADAQAGPGAGATNGTAGPVRTPGGGDVGEVPWVLRRQAVTADPITRELRARVSRPELYLLEATAIPLHAGFETAKKLGAAGLRERVFRSLIDIELARRNGVTPLPIEPR
jgi:hypothetical protein